MNRSPLHEIHEELGARFVDFGGWEMPVQYESVLVEHKAVRTGVGFFDVTHLGRFRLTGSGSRAALRRLLCNDIDRIEPGRCQYTMILNEDGGVVDDMIVWWWEEEMFWVLPNAVNQDRVMSTFAGMPGCEVSDLQMNTVMLAVQGPDASDVLEEVLGRAPGRFSAKTSEFDGKTVAIAGTGYTGEHGGEICTDAETGRSIVKTLIRSGVTPCGLGARDTLRLEAGLTLWGNDIDETTTPLEAGLNFAVAMDHDFVGRDRLVIQKENGVDRKLAGFVLSERGIPRKGYRVRTRDGGGGQVTSGNISPMLEKGIGLAYVSPPIDAGAGLEVEIRERWVPGTVVVPPFHEARE
jgi:aminomethyltransferase